MSEPMSFGELAGKLGGVAGALVSMKFLNGSWQERTTMAAAGAVFSYYAAPYASKLSGMPEGLCGFLLGLFGMAVISRAWEVIRDTPWIQVAMSWAKRPGTKDPEVDK